MFKLKYRSQRWLWLALAMLLTLGFTQLWATRLDSQPLKNSSQIIVDQFGWRPEAEKFVIFADPIKGQNSKVSYTPSHQFEVIEASSDSVVYTGTVQSWKNGAVDESSGDRVWSGDFSDFKQPGTYYIYDRPNQLRSHPFEINDDVYNTVLKTAVKAFYYQRCGTEIPSEYGGDWVHAPCHISKKQDKTAEPYVGRGAVKDVHGGWHDAGDFNKYVLFTSKTLWDLIHAYERNPQVFADDYNIPESGNGVPDLIDEIKWELDWVMRMQMPNGSVANRVASAECGEVLPHKDSEQRYYTEPTTWATSALIVDTANAARVFEAFDQAYPGYAQQLLASAERAWQYLAKAPQKAPTTGRDYGDRPPLSCAAQADEEQQDPGYRLWAAAELYRATGKSIYKDYFESNYKPIGETWFSSNSSLAYAAYALSPEPQPALLQEIKQALNQAVSNIDNLSEQSTHPYRSTLETYGWGSNRSKAEIATTLLLAQDLSDVNPQMDSTNAQNAEEYIHYLHGRNPLSLVYLSNMGEKGADAGAETSIMQLYHSWFKHGSRYDGAKSKYGPAPGFLVGGPNQFYSVKSVSPPFGEPPQKSYRDWNTSNPEASWELTEPAIYYQSAYVNLLSYFCSQPS